MVNSAAIGSQKYLKLLIILGALAVIGLSAWQYREHQKSQRVEEASAVYEKMIQAARQKELKTAQENALLLTQQYSDTPYGALGALMQGRVAIQQSEFPKAIEAFKLAMRLGKSGPIEAIAKVRLARVLANESKYDEALALLEEKKPAEGFVPLFEETKGDIYFKQNNVEKAKAAYLAAVQAAPAETPMAALQIKHNDLMANEVPNTGNMTDKKEKS